MSNNSNKVFDLGTNGIRVTLVDGVGEIVSKLDTVNNPALEGIETLILGMAIDGFNVCDPTFVNTVRSAVGSYE